MMRPWRLGIDLGGTKIEAAILDGNGRIRVRRRVPTPQGDYGATVRAVADLVRTVESELTGREGETGAERGALPVGVGIPGTISPATGLVKNANSVYMIGHPLDRDLAEALGRPVRLANDADCFTLSEATDGAAQGGRVVFGVILGTGVGGGIVIDGRLVNGPNAITGEWGHNPLPSPWGEEVPGPNCYCGRSGCIETFCSGPGITRSYGERTGLTLSVEEIVRRAETGEETAQETLRRHTDRLARSLATVINILDPHVVVLGGGVSHLPGLVAGIRACWRRYIFSDRVATELVLAQYGDSSGVRGAAWLWPANELGRIRDEGMRDEGGTTA
ncbi:MAG: ROK family protein [Magnetococcales bacterium]|nr:ROK family protein [Magnetococcales bacterium]